MTTRDEIAAWFDHGQEQGNTHMIVVVDEFRKGDAVLRVMERFRMDDGTDTFGTVARHYAGHDRVVIVTDEQNQAYGHRTIDDALPKQVPAYLWNIGGNRVGSIGSGPNRNTFAGMTDAAFRMVPLIEAGKNADWPF